jgi:osmotically inducible lipoprotein OsmB
MGSRLVLSMIAGAFLLSACGATQSDRAVSGAGIGAVTGLIGGALLGAPSVGLVLGAAAGATVGAATSPSQVDLGKPVWR